MKNFPVVCEIGCNHMGKIDLAKDLALSASQCGASVIKFRKEIIKNYYQRKNMRHPIQFRKLMVKLMESTESFEFDLSQHALLKEYIESLIVFIQHPSGT